MTDPRPRPKYGEYAPLPSAATDAENADAAQTPAAPGVSQPPVPPVAGPHDVNAQHTASSVAAEPGADAPPALSGQPERKRRMWDVSLTSMLLFLGVFDIISGFSTFANLGTVLSEGLTAQGFEGFSSVEQATEAGVILNVVRVSILAVTIALALLQIQRKRLAFWIPLAGAVLAGIVVVGVFVGVLMADPSFLAFAETQR